MKYNKTKSLKALKGLARLNEYGCHNVDCIDCPLEVHSKLCIKLTHLAIQAIIEGRV